MTTAPLQLFDALPSHIEDALRASIQRFGVLVPVVKDQHGRVVDGHHRSRIADELGISFITQTIEVADDDEAREIARTLNSDRRHMTDEQRREVVAHLRSLGHSLRSIGAAIGIDKRQVQRDIAKGGDSVPTSGQSIGLDGKLYPASRSASAEPEPEPIDDVPPWDEPESRDEPAPAVEPQALPAPVWSAEEEGLRAQLGGGATVVVSLRSHHANLVRWAESRGLLVRIDRRSDWGNPFEMPTDGDRDTVIANYAEHYLPHKPGLLGRMSELRGKALACWCAPQPCHGDVLQSRAEGGAR